MKIILDQTKCIGCGSCAAVCPRFFEMEKVNKSHLKESEKVDEIEKLEIFEAGCCQEAADICPVQAIIIE